MKREYFDIDLKDQCKRRMNSLSSLIQFGGIIHDQYEDKYFTGRQAWRNPLLLRVSLPEGKRWDFISHTIKLGCGIWLGHPAVPCLPTIRPERQIPLRGKHTDLKLRRSYRLVEGSYWIKDYQPDGSYSIYKDTEFTGSVLNGDLDLLSTDNRK